MKHLMNENREPLETNGQCILTPEFSSLLSSINELAVKNLDMLKLGNFVPDLESLWKITS